MASLAGNRYFISFVDDASRKSWIECFKSRDEVLSKIKQWRARVELDSAKRLVRLRCDNAKEYVKFERVIQAEGILVEYTSPYTPEQNGVAERYNRTIVQIVRAMLIGAKLPQKFWREAAKTANYLRNFLPSGHDTQSPEELWSGKTPSITHLRTFGCLVHVHIPKERRAKLDKVSYQGIFLGYHFTHQFRIFNPVSRRVEWPTAVKFLEYISGGQLLKQSKPGGTSVEVDASMNFGSDDDNERTSSLPIPINADAQEQVGEIQPASVQEHLNTNSSSSSLLPSSQPPTLANREKITGSLPRFKLV